MEFSHRLLDEGEAGVIWRTTKMQDLGQRLKNLELGPGAAEELQVLFQRVCEESAALDAMWETQRSSSLPREWWQDGCLDREAADRCNEQGRVSMAAGDAVTALEHFSHAVRYWPSAAAYHNNRAAAALKLGRPDIAAASAEAALLRDPGNLGAALRLGRARFALHQGESSLAAFEKALELCERAAPLGLTRVASQDPSRMARHRATAQRGLAAARSLCARRASAGAAEADSAAQGLRPGIGLDAGFPLGVVDGDTDQAPTGDKGLSADNDTAPAEALHAAQEVARAAPGLHAAQAALTEACIACGRWDDAAAAAARMLPGTDQTYLQGEIAWRRGDVEAALKLLGPCTVCATSASSASLPQCVQKKQRDRASQEVLTAAEGCQRRSMNDTTDSSCSSSGNSTPPLSLKSAGSVPPDKCEELRAFLQPLAVMLDATTMAEESGHAGEAAEQLTAALTHIHRARAAGLRAALLARRSAAQLDRGSVEAGLADAVAATKLEPDNPAAVRARARALSAARRHTEAFLLWRRLARLAPGTPGLEEETRRAAANCAAQQDRGAAEPLATDQASFARDGLPVDALHALGLDSNAAATVTPAAVRAAYRRQATRWHPDRWHGPDHTAKQREAAEEAFRTVQAAYERLLECIS